MLETANFERFPGPADGMRLRIALFSGNYNYIMDGAARAQNMLVAHLLERGHEVLVLAPTAQQPAFRSAGTLFSVPSIALPGKRAEYRLGLGLSRRIRARLDAFGPSIVHVATPDFTGLQALRYARSRAIPAVASFHTRFDTYGRYYRLAWLERHLTAYMRWFYAHCVHVYPPAIPMLEELRRQGIGKDLRLWGRGVDHALFRPQARDPDWRRRNGFADDDVVVAFVGRLVLEKGIDNFADAVRLAAAENPKTRALVVGDGPERARFESRLPEGIFLGYQSGEALARAYACADIFFNPSITEAAGNVTLEAMASGVCCVAADTPGTRCYVRGGETGLLLPPECGAAGYARSLVRLTADAALRVKMGAAGRARAVSDHHWPDVLDQVISHYCSAVQAYYGSAQRAVTN